MRIVQVSEVASINPRSDSIAPTEQISFVGMAQLDAQSAVATPLDSRSFSSVSKGYTIFNNHDILAAKITPCWENGKIGEASLTHPIGVGSTEFHVIRHGKSIDRRYLLHFLRRPEIRTAGQLRMTGSGGQRRVPASFIKELRIPLPPLDEQRRIAAILDQADAIRTKRRQQLNPLGELPGSLFWSNFSANYPIVRLEEVGTVQGGLQISRARAANPIEVPYLRVANVQRSNLDLSEIKLLRATDREITRTRLIAGDLLFVEGHASQFEVGRVSLWNGELRECVHQNHLIRFRASRRRLEPRFAEIWFNTQRGATHFRRAARTTSGLHTISATTVKSAPLPLPPIEIQRAFVERVEHINSQRSRVEAALACDDELFASLQSRAFKGEL